MASIEDFIQNAASQLGAEEGSVRSATGGFAKLLRDQVGEADFSQLASKVPGLDAVIGSAPAADPAPEDDLVGGLAGAASALGGGGGGGFDLGAALSLLGKSGLDGGKVGSLGKMLLGFLQQNAGQDLVAGILSKVPLLKGMLG